MRVGGGRNGRVRGTMRQQHVDSLAARAPRDEVEHVGPDGAAAVA
jgi:hypothetical protein